MSVSEIRSQAPERDRVYVACDSDDPSLRPTDLSAFVGQAKVRRHMRISLDGALSRDAQMGHTLLTGPPGLGKTTLAAILANEMGAVFHTLAAPSVQRNGDLAKALVSLGKGDVLFIDEIHRLPVGCHEFLYSAMEDYEINLEVGDGFAAKLVRLTLPRFTLVGATTRGTLPKPLRERFPNSYHLEFYSPDELATVVTRSAGLLGMELGRGAAEAVATRSRMTPRVANGLLLWLRDFAASRKTTTIDVATSEAAFAELEMDSDGLTVLDRRYLSYLASRNGRPVGVSTIAAALGEEPDIVLHDVEPWLVLSGKVERSPRGRILASANSQSLWN